MSPQEIFTLHLGIVGAGNVGWHLGCELHSHGLEFSWVYSHSPRSAADLAEELECEAYHGAQLPSKSVDLLLVTVPDSETIRACEVFGSLSRYVVHTSGSSPLPPTAKDMGGVFYPLQTFTKGHNVRLRGVMCLVEAPNDLLRRVLFKLGGLLGMEVYTADTAHRRWVHLLGVLSNNFVNHLLTLAYMLSEQESLHEHIQPMVGQCYAPYSPLRMLMPLLQQTLEKAERMGPYASQTGPARRGDACTLAQQRELLSQSHPASLAVYDALTTSILRLYTEDSQPTPSDAPRTS